MIPRLAADALTCVLPDGRSLFDRLSLGLTAERVGLVGPNGGGKSTLLAVLAGERVPTHGTVRRTGRVGYLPQDAPSRQPAHATVAHALGVAESLAAVARVEAGSLDPRDHDAAADGWSARRRAEALLDALGLPGLSLDRTMRSLSGGEATRVLLTGQLLAAPDVLLLDEPTNHLDGEARDAVRRLLGEWRGALLVASHDRELLAHVDRILELSPNGARWYGGAIDTYEAVRAAEQDAALAALHHAERERERARAQAQAEREAQDRRAGSGRRRADRRGASAIERSGARERATGTQSRLAGGVERRARDAASSLAEAKARVEERAPITFSIPTADVHGAQRLVSLIEASVSFDGTPALSPITLEVGARSRIGVTGPNGSGKSTLLALLTGTLPASSGDVRHHVPLHRIARLTQDAWHLPDAPSLHEALSQARPDLPATEARSWLAAFGFRGVRAERAVQGLSGGERLRLSLACAMDPITPPALLLLDEPTNHLDLDAVLALEQALRDYAGALVVVSHDRRFLGAIGLTQWVACARSGAPPDAAAGATTSPPPPR